MRGCPVLVKFFNFDNIAVVERENYFRSVFEVLKVSSEQIGLLKVIIPSNTTARKHYHKEHFEIFIFLRGRGRVLVESQRNANEFYVTEGSILIIEPCEKHTVEALDKPLEIVVIKVPHKPEDKVLEG